MRENVSINCMLELFEKKVKPLKCMMIPVLICIKTYTDKIYKYFKLSIFKSETN